jgi:hypothetical protein
MVFCRFGRRPIFNCADYDSPICSGKIFEEDILNGKIYVDQNAAGLNFTGKPAVVTGGSNGIYSESSRRLFK